MARVKNPTVHKRVHLRRSTVVTLSMMASLLDMSETELMEVALLYGLAYVNEQSSLNMEGWKQEVKLPDIKDVKEYLDNYVRG